MPGEIVNGETGDFGPADYAKTLIPIGVYPLAAGMI
jgi:hypothetical protein